jgi:hypothetical protein
MEPKNILRYDRKENLGFISTIWKVHSSVFYILVIEN